MITFEEFCGGPLWNESLLLENSWPQFPPCFMNTVLVWIPCCFLWVVTPCFLYLEPHRRRLYPSRLFWTKMVLACIQLVLSLVRLGLRRSHEDVAWAEILSYILYTFNYTLVISLMEIDRRRGVTTSPLLFLYWTLKLFVAIIFFYTAVELEAYKEHLGEFVVACVCYSLIISQFILQWTSDNPHHMDGYSRLGKCPCPEIEASFPSTLFVWWMTPLILNGYRREITEAEMWQLHPRDSSNYLVPRFEQEWNKQCQNGRRGTKYSMKIDEITEKSHLLNSKKNKSSHTEKPPSLVRTLWRIYRLQCVGIVCLRVLGDILKLVNPLVMSALISYVSSKTPGEEWKGYTLSVSLFLVQVISTIVIQKCVGWASVLGMQIKTTCIAAIFNKSLTISNEARKTSTTGEIMNLMSVDCSRINDVFSQMFFIPSVPLQIIFSTVLIYQIIGPSVFAGIGILVVLIPLNSYITTQQRLLQIKNLLLKDKRIKLIDEILNGIKVLKLYAWEPPFLERVRGVRRQEIYQLYRIAILYIIVSVSFTMAPFLCVLTSFTSYILSDPNNVLDANKAFVTLSFYNILRAPLFRFPMILASTIQAFVSVKRINTFLCREDFSPDAVDCDPSCGYALSIRNGAFTWDSTTQPILKGINLNVNQGRLIAVVGHVGAGKSSLLSAILGEMVKMKGTVKVQSSTAYVPQLAWIQNRTLKDNILFGRSLRQKKYDTVLSACALDVDLSLLPSGDMTEIGEQGINLSGGQKQRVSLARAVYHNTGMYLLDDPLSAVDSHVGKHIFQKVIGPKGLLRGKTRIFVTHGVHWLPMVDQIVVMDHGVITETGSYEELMSHDGAFAQFLKTYLSERETGGDPEIEKMTDEIERKLDKLTSDETSGNELMTISQRKVRKKKQSADITKSIEETSSVHDSHTSKMAARGKLIQAERMGSGKVKWSVFFTYARAAGFPTFILSLLLYFVPQGLTSGASFFLTYWTEDPALVNASLLPRDEMVSLNLTYLGEYAAFAPALGVASAFCLYLLRTRMIRAAARLHDALIDRVFRSPMSFFDTTPSGRIINRLSRDVETIDNTMMMNVRMFMNQFSSVVTILVTISINTPLFISIIVPLIILYVLVQKFYIPSSRQLKRIESVTRSPIYVNFSETITGAAVIRSFGATDRFIEESKRRVDRNQTFYFAGIMATRWLGFYLDFMGSVVILAAALFSVITPGISGAVLGLSVTYALSISSVLSMMVRQISNMETNFVAVERVKEYSELPIEGEWHVAHNRPPREWPSEGQVEMRAYSTRYRPGLDLVLRQLTCCIDRGTKVGVVGRTGAGKSSLLLAVFRLLEADAGSIIIDGVDISSIGLHDIRSRITILPQDPVLFSGTLRMNIDPFSKYPDDAVWSALERSHLKEFVLGTSDQLEYDCGERGQNLSVGQRQLVCLSRALLRQSKVLLLDEATAAVDMETDSLIQTTIRAAFHDSTVITIAHRISTVMDNDKVMVMDDGHVKEFDCPVNLLLDKNSMFYSLAEAAGIVP